ncbi:hypothetical protein AMECASPLE_038664 [Ameca splendens]|uniref:Uncharacterized protein n=1 Tax=Ameca splendens TaxID=208324 RepID=A0ABV0Z640_9TELE
MLPGLRRRFAAMHLQSMLGGVVADEGPTFPILVVQMNQPGFSCLITEGSATADITWLGSSSLRRQLSNIWTHPFEWSVSKVLSCSCHVSAQFELILFISSKARSLSA